MARFDDVDPQDIDPDTGRPYPGYSSPAIDTEFHDIEMAVDDPSTVDDVRSALRRLKAEGDRGIARTVDELLELPDSSMAILAAAFDASRRDDA